MHVPSTTQNHQPSRTRNVTRNTVQQPAQEMDVQENPTYIVSQPRILHGHGLLQPMALFPARGPRRFCRGRGHNSSLAHGAVVVVLVVVVRHASAPGACGAPRAGARRRHGRSVVVVCPLSSSGCSSDALFTGLEVWTINSARFGLDWVKSPSRPSSLHCGRCKRSSWFSSSSIRFGFGGRRLANSPSLVLGLRAGNRSWRPAHSLNLV